MFHPGKKKMNEHMFHPPTPPNPPPNHWKVNIFKLTPFLHGPTTSLPSAQKKMDEKFTRQLKGLILIRVFFLQRNLPSRKKMASRPRRSVDL